MSRPPSTRSRPLLLVAWLLVVAAGIASRSFPHALPAVLGKYPGDALWAWMALLGVAWLRPDLRPLLVALLALAISCLVECSQLYQAPWLNAIRAHRLGHAILGSGFHGPDFVAYAIGVGCGFAVDRWCFWRGSPREA